MARMTVARSFVREFITFGLKEARACVFAGSFFVLLFLSNHIPLFGLPRYDFIFIAVVLIQIVLYATGIETKGEVKLIFLFHIIGLVLELYKTNPAIGSWSYPEFGYLKIATVPLYSGFMYAAVGSYVSQAWKVFNLELTNYKRYSWGFLLCAVIYVNFFTNHFYPDIRLLLIPLVFAFFWKVRVYFTVIPEKRRSMPLALSFVMIAFFIWIAENISTYLGAWKYPDQAHFWSPVSGAKITSWFLLVIVSFIIIAHLKHFKRGSPRSPGSEG
jgi:uncharacterized membrane protein YoaT (DUF817 family)